MVAVLPIGVAVVTSSRSGWVAMLGVVVGMLSLMMVIRVGLDRLVLRVRDRAGTVSRLIRMVCTVLTLLHLGKVMLHQKLMFELLMSARLLIRLRSTKGMCEPRSSAMHRSIAGRGVADHGLSTSSCSSSSKPRSLRRLPDLVLHAATHGRRWHVTVRLAMIHLRLSRRVYERIDGSARGWQGCEVRLVIVGGIRIDGISAGGGLPIVEEGHGG